jgi:hypothetical protein
MAEQSHREEMSAAIRAQRERNAVPKTIAPEREQRPPAAAEPPTTRPPEPKGPEPKGLFRRLRGK